MCARGGRSECRVQVLDGKGRVAHATHTSNPLHEGTSTIHKRAEATHTRHKCIQGKMTHHFTTSAAPPDRSCAICTPDTLRREREREKKTWDMRLAAGRARHFCLHPCLPGAAGWADPTARCSQDAAGAAAGLGWSPKGWGAAGGGEAPQSGDVQAPSGA